jgi:hypothetical protein
VKKSFYKYKSLDGEEDLKKLESFLQQKVWMTPLTEFTGSSCLNIARQDTAND